MVAAVCCRLLWCIASCFEFIFLSESESFSHSAIPCPRVKSERFVTSIQLPEANARSARGGPPVRCAAEAGSRHRLIYGGCVRAGRHFCDSEWVQLSSASDFPELPGEQCSIDAVERAVLLVPQPPGVCF